MKIKYFDEKYGSMPVLGIYQFIKINTFNNVCIIKEITQITKCNYVVNVYT